jgi:hypothetical protein
MRWIEIKVSVEVCGDAASGLELEVKNARGAPKYQIT